MPVEGADQFRKAAAGLAGADKTVRAELAKTMRRIAKPITQEIKDEVRKAPSQGAVGAAAIERAGHALNRGTRAGKKLTERQVRSRFRRAAKLSSLRENIAAATVSVASTSAKGAGVTFRVRTSAMPPSQRKLPRRWNRSSGWRHPVFGNRNIWVKQTGRPFFDRTIYAHRDEVRAAITDAMQVAAEKIVHAEEESTP